MHMVDYLRLCVGCKVRGAAKCKWGAIGGGEVSDCILALKSTSDEDIFMRGNGGNRGVGVDVLAKIDNGIGFCSLCVCTPYSLALCKEDVIVGCRCDDVSQLEVRDEGARCGADPLELEEVVCAGRGRYVLHLSEKEWVGG